MKRIVTTFLVVATAHALFATGTAEEQGSSVVASTTFVGDVVGRIVGDTVPVHVLMEHGQNPHSYTPTPREIALVESADVVFVNGFGLEEELLETIESVTARVVALSDGINPIVAGDDGHDHGDDDHEAEHDDHEAEHDDHDADHNDRHDHGNVDPHVWFDPNNVIQWTQNATEVLGDLYPEHRDAFESNRDRFVAELVELDREVRAAFAGVSRERRALITDHVALTYYAAEYNLKIVAGIIPAVSDQTPASPRHIADVARVVHEERIGAIVVGDTASRSLRELVEAVAEEAGRPVPIVEIPTGSLARSGERGSDYIDFVRVITERIAEALSE